MHKYTLSLLEILNELSSHPDVVGFNPELDEVRNNILSGAELFPVLPHFKTYSGYEYLNDEYQKRLLVKETV